MKGIKNFTITLLFLLLVLSACGKGNETEGSAEPSDEELDNLTESGLPIVDEEVSLDMFAGNPPESADDWNDVMIWDEYKDMTNVNVNWETVQEESLEEKRNLKLGSGGDLPDVFYSASLSNTDILKYGGQGLFMPLNDLIDEHAPNLKKLMEEYPEIEKAITYPDGNIYSMPTIYDPDASSLRLGPRPWIDEDVLEEVDMDMPETTEEYYEFLKAVRDQTDKTPFGSYSVGMLLRWINGSFGLGNRGFDHPQTDVDEDGELRFIPTSDEYKEMLEYVHKLYDEKLIEQNIFEENATDKFMANASDGEYASTVAHDPEDLFNLDSMVGAPALEGPFGDKLITGIAPSVADAGSFVITSDNESPATTVRWADHFFSDEGAKFFFMGKEGETYEEDEDGEPQYVDDITEGSGDLTFEQRLSEFLVWPGGGYASTILKEDYFQGLETSENSIEAAEKLEPYIIDDVWAQFTHTKEENDILTTTGSDIEKYVEEMRDKFIVGDTPFSEWDDYVSKLEKMGLDDYVDVKKEAMERYEEN